MTAASVEIVANEDRLAELEAPWAELWHRTRAKTPFQSPAWLLPWWRQFGTSRPVVAVLRDGPRLLGVLPAYVLNEGGSRKLLPLGIGISDYLDALIAPEAPDDTAARLLAAVLHAVEDVAVCELVNLPDGSPLTAAPVPRGWHASNYPGEPCPVLDLPVNAVDAATILPPKMRRKLRMNRHRADRRGGWTTCEATSETLTDDLDALIRLHQARWVAQGEPGVLADPRVGGFYRDAAPRLLETGLLRLATLWVEGQVAAAVMALRAPPDRLMLYLSGFDEAFASISPGTILLGDMVEAAMREGVREVHFLLGGEAYKFAWGAVDRRNTCRHLWRAP